MSAKIYTKTGDKGETGLVGGNRILKSDIRLDAYGTVDELNAHIGLLMNMNADDSVNQLLLKVQNALFVVGSKLASDEKGKVYTAKLVFSQKDIDTLEEAIDAYDRELPPLKNFVLPGGSALVSQCHVARAVCRRAERSVVRLNETADVEPLIIQYLNRLSDYLFVLSRKLAKNQGIEEIYWFPV
ncbi:MAG: cob(I)yrinic acid a,c-diamide adenosyltransferase [Prolixibacteraceae bacterium]|nr:cob(I)yrinic acid a,c-diamide adenosyltransferase [Prolixibacteraceae bacterium]